MRELLSIAVLALVLMFSVGARANGFNPPVAEDAMLASEYAVGGLGLSVGATATGVGAVAGGTLVYLIANQVDPWHPLACALFGDDARVGTETSAHCN